ncbi:MAG: DNA polymerase III subunit gamma/tau, partial [Bacteroidota bacterium]|nr:DNA polymerase III subunit gamma/tau [Bacteroidota bacterium]
EMFLKNDIPGVLLTFNEILDHGFDAFHFITGLSNHFRDLLVCRDAVTVQLLEVGGEIKQRYKQQASICDPQFIIDSITLSNECELQYKASQSKRLLVELTLIRISQLTLKKKLLSQMS